MGGCGVKVQHFPLTMLVVLTFAIKLTIPEHRKRVVTLHCQITYVRKLVNHWNLSHHFVAQNWNLTNIFNIPSQSMPWVYLMNEPNAAASIAATLIQHCVQKHIKFGAISDNFRLWSRISPERIDVSKIGKVLDQLQPGPLRWWSEKDGEFWSTNKKVYGLTKAC